MRLYGTEDAETLLFFEQYAPSTGATMTVAGRPLRPLANGRKIELRFGPRDLQGWELEPTVAAFEGFGDALILPFTSPAERAMQEQAKRERRSPYTSFVADTQGVPHIAPEDVAGIEWLSLKRGEREVILELPLFAQEMAALNGCALDLLRDWQLDPEQHLTMTRKAEPINLPEIAQRIARNYPSNALLAGEQGDFNLCITVGADGTIEECAITDATNTRYLRTPACDVFGDRAMFAPAEDAAGEPMRSYYQTQIAYRLK